MIGVSTKQFCRSFEFALVLDLLVVRQGKCVAAGTRVILNLICLFSTLHLMVHLSSGTASAGWVMWMSNTSVSESSSELVSILCTRRRRLHTDNQWLGFLQ